MLLCTVLTSCAQAKFDGDLRVRYDYNLKEYLKAGKYKGISVYIGDTNVTEKEVENSVNRNMVFGCDWNEITDRPCQNGDIIGISFQAYLAGDGDKSDRIIYSMSRGFINGEPMENLEGSSKVLSVVCGTDELFPGFDEQTVGKMKVGDRMTLTCTLPEPCWDYPEYAGEQLEFDVICTYINEMIYPEDKDAHADELGYGNMESFKSSTASNLQRLRNEHLKDYVTTRLWKQINKNFSVKKYPEKELEETKKSLLAQVQANADKKETELSVYVKNTYGVDMDAFNVRIEKQAKELVKDDMIVYYIARDQKFAITDTVYNEKGLEIAQENEFAELDQYLKFRAYSMGFASNEGELTDEVIEKSKNSLKEEILTRMVDEFVYGETEQKTSK